MRDALGDCLDEERANPADFLIDVLGLAARQPTMGRPDSPRDLPGRARSSNTLSEDVEARPAAADPATPGTSVRDGLIAHYRASALHRATLQRIGARVRSPGPIIPVHTPCRGDEAALQRRVHTVAMFARRVRRLSENRSDIFLRYVQVRGDILRERRARSLPSRALRTHLRGCRAQGCRHRLRDLGGILISRIQARQTVPGVHAAADAL